MFINVIDYLPLKSVLGGCLRVLGLRGVGRGRGAVGGDAGGEDSEDSNEGLKEISYLT